MPANAVVSNSDNIDWTAFQLVPKFGGHSGPKWSCQFVRITAGAEPSHAIVRIPLKDLDTTAPAIAAVKDGPLSKIRIGTTCDVMLVNGSGKGALVLSGSVVDIKHDWGPNRDEAAVMVQDDRWFLKALPIRGSWWMSGDSEETGTDHYSYRHGWHWHINPGGAPNAIWRSVTGWPYKVPMMCDPYYGLAEDEQPPNSLAMNESKSCYWTPSMVIMAWKWQTSIVASTKAPGNWKPDV